MVTALFQTWLKLQSRPSGVSNEARFVFTVQSIVMSQKLKGTLTFIVKVNTYTRTHTHHFYLMTCALSLRQIFYLLYHHHMFVFTE